MSIFNNLNNLIDIISYIEKNELDDIIIENASIYKVDPYNLKLAQVIPCGMNRGYYFTLNDIKRNKDEYLWIYDRLEDLESKEIYLNLIRYRVTAAVNFLESAKEKNYKQYFDNTIINFSDNEVFVDCGSYIGDTIEEFISYQPKYKKIYSYEPSIEFFHKCVKSTRKFKNIKYLRAGVGEEYKQIGLVALGAGSYVSDLSEDKINIVTLDGDIKEKITFLKMDIEGEEINAINGAKQHIINDNPKMAICLYHEANHIWKIPKVIDSINSNYKFYIRQYELDTVLYAIPK